MIATTFFDAQARSTIDEILEQVRAVDSPVGYATAYRTMKMLTEGGIANELHFGEGATRYEVADEDGHHDHLICEKCGQIVEFEEPLIEELQERVAKAQGFIITHHRHELYGHCTDAASCDSRRKDKNR